MASPQQNEAIAKLKSDILDTWRRVPDWINANASIQDVRDFKKTHAKTMKELEKVKTIEQIESIHRQTNALYRRT